MEQTPSADTIKSADAQGADPEAIAREFHIEEYKQLRGELAATMTRLESIMRLAIVVVAGVFSWLLAQGFGVGEKGWCLKLPFSILLIGWFLPLAFVIVAAIAAATASKRGSEIAEYIRQELETKLAWKGKGWETVLHPKTPILFRT